MVGAAKEKARLPIFNLVLGKRLFGYGGGGGGGGGSKRPRDI